MAAASPAWADGKLLIPRSANVEGAYLSTQLLLEPCMSDRALAAITDAPSARKDAEAARKALRPGTCDDPALVEDGPVGVMESICNGMPDLLTSARESMAEHETTYYRYDGKQYRSVYAFTAMGIGADDNGNDLEIAVDGKPDARVVCR